MKVFCLLRYTNLNLVLLTKLQVLSSFTNYTVTWTKKTEQEYILSLQKHPPESYCAQ